MATNNAIKAWKPDFQILDGLRGIAAAYVVLFHSRGDLFIKGGDYSQIVPVSQWSIKTRLLYLCLQGTTLGREFVIFFFILSGFSIAHSLSKNGSIMPFYMRRIIRLYPTYIVSLCWAALVFFIAHKFAVGQLNVDEKSVFDNWNYVLNNLLYLHTGGEISAQFWSLSLEIIFYLLIPWFFLSNLNYYVGLSIIGYIWGWIVSWNGISGHSTLAIFFLDYNFFFAIGILTYKHFDIISKKLQLGKIKFIGVLLFLFMLMVVAKLKLGEGNKVSILLAAGFTLIMIVNFLHYKIKNKVLTFLGDMSYTIYTTHVATIYLFIVFLNEFGFGHHTKITAWYIWPIGFLLCFLFAIPIYYLGEHPSKLLLNKMRK
jgi:peptidoglycan/LPS O-acetylase OafA/YrhL